MLTIVCSSQHPLDEFEKQIIKSSGINSSKIEFLGYENKGEYSLTEIYNRGLKEAKFNHIVFLHNDIIIETKNWGDKLLKLHNKNKDFSIIGIAGTKNMSDNGIWWTNVKDMFGRLKHSSNGKTWESNYSDDLNNGIEETVIVDGVFFSVDKTKIKNSFDESLKGFHFYDIDFCLSNYLKDCKIGVSTSIKIIHKSIGMTNDQWETNRLELIKKYSKNLPLIIPQDFKNIKLKALLCVKDVSDNLLNELKKLNNNIDLTIVTNSKYDIKLKNKGFKFVSLNEPPTYKLGDGKWLVNTKNGPVVTNPGTLYKISNYNFDVIHVLDNDLVNFMLRLYPDSKLLTNEFNSNDLLNQYKALYLNETTVKQYNHGVTFIIPTLNRSTLNRTITSLKNQSNKNWNAIVVFDGVEPINFDDDRINSVKIEKEGVLKNSHGQSGLVRNHGIKDVMTEWVAFVDDDDTISNDYVEILLQDYLEKDFVIFKMKYENGLVLPKSTSDIKFGDVGISFAYKTKMNVFFDENRDGEDFDLIVKLKNKTNNYVISDKITYNVRH